MPPSQAANDPEIGIGAATHGNGADPAPAAPPGNSAGHATNPPKPSTNTILAEVVDAAKPEILYSSVQNDRINKVLNLATIQRVILLRLQLQIVEESGSLLGSSGEEKTALVDKLKTPMAEYAQAIRDWELMGQYEATTRNDPLQDPFKIHSGWDMTGKAFDSASLNDVGIYARAALQDISGTFRQRNMVNKDRRLKAFLFRFAMALFGGVALIAPMLLMVLHKDRATDLATTSVAVFLFAVVVAYYSEATPEAIVGAVAAYAAVLVVFVGTLDSPGSTTS